ncbi:MAG: LPS assembly lipoprotein LptE [Gammaproteobacteria bacterium]
MTASLLVACGFSLRGTDSMPPALAQTFVQASNQSMPLVRELDRQLTIAGGAVTKVAAGATATLRILEDDSGERVLSLATTGGPEELEAYHIVSFELVQDGRRVYGPDKLTLRRDYTFDKNDVLGKRRESETLRQQLRRDIVALLLRRLTLAPQIT